MAFLPFNVSTLVILLLEWTRVVVLPMAAVKGFLFARGSPPNRSNWTKNRQCSNTQSERTDTQPTSDEYNERFFELRSAVVSIPTTPANSLYLTPYDGCQDTEHTGRNCRVFGTNQTNSSENEACCHTQNCLNADKTLRLFPSFEKRFCAVACASSTQPIFKIQQPKGRRTLQLNEALCHRSNKSGKRSTNRSQKMRSHA